MRRCIATTRRHRRNYALCGNQRMATGGQSAQGKPRGSTNSHSVISNGAGSWLLISPRSLVARSNAPSLLRRWPSFCCHSPFFTRCKTNRGCLQPLLKFGERKRRLAAQAGHLKFFPCLFSVPFGNLINDCLVVL